MKKVLIIHRYEKGQGSTILAVVSATKRGRRLADEIGEKEKNHPGFMSCDRIEIEEREVEGLPKRKRNPWITGAR